MDEERIKQAVKERYAELAQGGTCCGGPRKELSERRQRAQRLYSEEAIAALPDSVIEAAAGCGNPIALAELRPGEVVLDLGSGGGIDVFLAAERVGSGGRVIGLDMTPEMIALARQNLAKLGISNAEFRLGEMECMPLASKSVDVVISNCVINLSPDKDAVFREAHRVLKPGGRLAVSDIVLRGELPEELRGNPQAWASCLAGALPEEDYLAKIRAAGFSQVEVVGRSESPSRRQGFYSIQVRALKA